MKSVEISPDEANILAHLEDLGASHLAAQIEDRLLAYRKRIAELEEQISDRQWSPSVYGFPGMKL